LLANERIDQTNRNGQRLVRLLFGEAHAIFGKRSERAVPTGAELAKSPAG
jgi:hypothetical protein